MLGEGQREGCSRLLAPCLQPSGGWGRASGPRQHYAALPGEPRWALLAAPPHPSCLPACKLTSSTEASLQLQPPPGPSSPFVDSAEQARATFCLGVSGTLREQELWKTECVHMGVRRAWPMGIKIDM